MQSGYGSDSHYKYSLGEHSGSESRHKERRKDVNRSESQNSDLHRSRNQSGSNQSSQGERASHSGTSRSRMSNVDNKFCEHLLNEDFQLMMALSPSPDEAFSPKSADHRLATLWHNKLKNYPCESIYDLRMRQDYMSYFSSCLNQKELRGVFLHDPPEILTWVEFQEMTDPHPNPMTMGNQSAWLAMASMMQSQGNNQTTKAGQPTLSPRHLGGSNKRKSFQGTTHNVGYKAKPKLVPKNVNGSSTSSSSSFGRKSSSHRRSRHPIVKPTTKEKMNNLLDTITGELSGELLPGTNEYLELELKRYREFCAQHRCNNPDTASTSSSNDRTQLLLNMQNDLIKFLSE